MKVKDIIKKQTTIIAIAVVLVAMTAMGASYAIFFDIKKNTTDQVITAGTLKVTISGVQALDDPQVLDDTAGKTSKAITYTIKNEDDAQSKSNLPNAYTMYVYADDANQVDLSKIKIDFVGGNSWTKKFSDIVSGSESGAIGIPASSGDSNTGCTIKGEPDGTPKKCVGYKLESGEIAAGESSETRTLRVWVDEGSVSDEIENQKLSLRLYIVSEVSETS